MKMLKNHNLLSKAMLAAVFMVGISGFSMQASAEEFAAPVGALQIACGGPSTMTFNPPLLSNGQISQFTNNINFEICPVGSNGIVSGSVIYQNIGDILCDMPLGTTKAQQVIRWSNGQSSTLTYNARVQTFDRFVTVLLQGTITSGLFKNKRAAELFSTDMNALEYQQACYSDGGAPSGSGIGRGINGLKGFTALTIF
jgi:hypothetical protein